MEVINFGLYEKLKRVGVIGTSCAGKTDFSHRLAQLLGSKHIELDALPILVA